MSKQPGAPLLAAEPDPAVGDRFASDHRSAGAALMPLENAAGDAAWQRLVSFLNILYPDRNGEELAKASIRAIGLESLDGPAPHRQNLWSERDAVLITYGDNLQEEDKPPLQTLTEFAEKELEGFVSIIHILPFFPWSSDDGFSVMDYTSVNPALGDWPHIEALAQKFRIMGDVVINHCSARSLWFENWKAGKEPGLQYFVEENPDTDLSAVVRPRSTPLLRAVETSRGVRHVWCTFGPDQIDLDFRNPEVLLCFLGLLDLYLKRGLRWFRLDAVAFIWKIPGTSCMNLPETHTMVRLLRLLMEHREAASVLITETNVPNGENLAYFGNANEAHLIYNFSLPPLLVHGLVGGTCRHLKSWLASMPPAQSGTAYLNFIASHDGIGLRPAEGLLSDDEMDRLLTTMQNFGGKISSRGLADGTLKPYEINISLWDAMQGTTAGADAWQMQRYLCAHAVMLALEGVPALYLHSLLATTNDTDRVIHSGQFRAINRHKWSMSALVDALESPLHHREVFDRLRRLLALRARQKAFHPNATQYTLQTGDAILSFWRQSADRQQSIFALFNFTEEPRHLSLAELNLTLGAIWTDLCTGISLEPGQQTLVLAPYQYIWLSDSQRHG